MTKDISNWDPELQALAARYDPATVQVAFDVAEKIGERGYPGIFFTQKAESKVARDGPRVAWSKVDSELRDELRKRGFKAR